MDPAALVALEDLVDLAAPALAVAAEEGPPLKVKKKSLRNRADEARARDAVRADRDLVQDRAPDKGRGSKALSPRS